MSTRYILHGGFATRDSSKNSEFFKEILNINKKELHILLILFAKEEDDWGEKAKRIEDEFKFNTLDKILNFEIAHEENFIKQAKRADIIYIQGGKTLKLLNILKSYPDFKELWRDKTVAGESAGAYVLSSYFYSKTEGGIFQGLGCCPVKTICHYIGENREKLNYCPPNLEELLLEDYKFKIFII